MKAKAIVSKLLEVDDPEVEHYLKGVKPLADGNIVVRVTDRLNEIGVPCSYEYPGYISIPAPDGLVWNFGDINELWGGDLVTQEHEVIDGADIGIRSDSQNVDAIAEAIANFLRQWLQQHER